MRARERFSVQERAARWQRRHTGPWTIAARSVGPLHVVVPYRRRRRIEYVELDVALHDLQRSVGLEARLASERLARFIRASSR